MYTTTINQNGMILLNKAAREALGVKLGDKVTIDFDSKSARVERRMSDEEFIKGLSKIRAKYGDTDEKKVDAVLAVRQWRDGKNPEITKLYKEKYLHD